MATLSEYGGIKPSIITFKPYKETIETISGLLLLYPIVEEEYLSDGIVYHFFKKGFWGKKQMGYLKIEYLPGKHTDTELTVYEDGTPLPPYTDIVIGVEYGSQYNSVNWMEQSRTFDLKSPHRQVLSVGILFQNLEAEKQVFRTLQAEEFNNAGHILMINTGRMNYLRKHIELLDIVKAKLKPFDRFLSRSAYQPVKNEQ